ncbi:MAG: sugar phosphate nucleotidyltransferase [Candidatus Uhrbacteria bacterium]
MKAIILAGGVGTRLWPMSRMAKPKQFFNLVTEEPLIRDTYRRLLRLFSTDDIYFAVSPTYVDAIKETFPEVENDHIIIEPAKRDTGPAMGYTASILELSAPDESIVFIPSDHWIEDEEAFLNCLRVGDRLIQETGKMLDIAIAPSFPSTVLGYTKISDSYDTIDGVEVYNFAGHVEKPDFEVAKKFLDDGHYLWHANYYMWTPKRFMASLEKQAPAIGQLLRKIQAELVSGDRSRIRELFESTPAISIDYAMTEKMDPEDVLIIKGDFGWSDIGAWDTLHDQKVSDTSTSRNVTRGQVLILDSEDNLFYASKERTIAAVGVSDLVVVDTGDAILVCPKSQAQRVKELVEEMKNQKLDHLL